VNKSECKAGWFYLIKYYTIPAIGHMIHTFFKCLGWVRSRQRSIKIM